MGYVNITKSKDPPKEVTNSPKPLLPFIPLKMPRRRSSAAPMHAEIVQIDSSMRIPRPIQDDMMSVTTNPHDDELPRALSEDIILEDDDEVNRPEDFSPRLWQLFNRIQRRGTQPLFPADWQVQPAYDGAKEN